jgi:lipoprotein Spr
MFKRVVFFLSPLFVLAGCSSLKPVSNNPAASRNQVIDRSPKFLNNISVNPESSTTRISTYSKTNARQQSSDYLSLTRSTIESSVPLQFKYAVLLNTEVEEVKNIRLYQYIDQWYGTPYCLGGTTKGCIDCSAFVQSFFSAVFDTNLPRTARDQYKVAQKISSTELLQGDLLFFNTRGGVSHVGIYLQNNKFVHASTSGGVTISDMFDPYYSRHFIGAGRITKNKDELARN